MKPAMNTSPEFNSPESAPIRNENNVEQDLKELSVLIEESNEQIALLQEKLARDEVSLETIEEERIDLFGKLSEANAQLAGLLERELQLRGELKKFRTGKILAEAVVPPENNIIELLPNYNNEGYERIMSSLTQEGLEDALKGLVSEEKRLDDAIVGANANDLDQLSSKLLVVKDKLAIVRRLLNKNKDDKQGKVLR